MARIFQTLTRLMNEQVPYKYSNYQINYSSTIYNIYISKIMNLRAVLIF